MEVREFYDITVRVVAGYGFLPILLVDGKEVYRGSFKETSLEALTAAEEMFAKLNRST